MQVSVSRQLPGLGSSVLTNEAGVTIAFSIHESNKQQKNDSNPLKRSLLASSSLHKTRGFMCAAEAYVFFE